MKKKIGFIGTGNIAQAMIKGLLASGFFVPDDIIGTGRTPKKLKSLEKEYKITTTTDNLAATIAAETVVLAVKPQDIDSVMKTITSGCKNKLIISFAAGVPTKHVEKMMRGARVIRAMPNLPVQVCEGATAMCYGDTATKKDVEYAKKLFKAVGHCVEVYEELMDAVTGLSGTGPMYVFIIIEALSDAGVRMGLSRDVANILATQTVLGSAKMVRETTKHTSYLKDMVTSPAGTAISALHTIEKSGMRALLMDAVEIATTKSKNLGKREESQHHL
jgi:pyrroline-5-carboxylate reductase